MRMIDADALINTLQEMFDKREKEARFTGNRGVTVTWNDAIYHIKTAPTIEERKTGRWEPQISTFAKPVCSECGEPCFGLHGFDYTLTPYCPNCGADMRKTT